MKNRNLSNMTENQIKALAVGCLLAGLTIGVIAGALLAQ